MELYILRHGIAETAPIPPSGGDAGRRLTAEGVRKMKLASKGMRALGVQFDAILSSPLVRARESAEIVAAAFRLAKRLDTTAALAPDGNPEQLVAKLRKS